MNHTAPCILMMEPRVNQPWVQPQGDELVREDRNLDDQLHFCEQMAGVDRSIAVPVPTFPTTAESSG